MLRHPPTTPDADGSGRTTAAQRRIAALPDRGTDSNVPPDDGAESPRSTGLTAAEGAETQTERGHTEAVPAVPDAGWVPDAAPLPTSAAAGAGSTSAAAGSRTTTAVARLARRGPWGTLAEKWVPESLRDARVNPGRRGATVLSLVAAVAATIAAVGVWWAQPDAVPVAPSVGPSDVPQELSGGFETAARRGNGELDAGGQRVARGAQDGTGDASVPPSAPTPTPTSIVVSVTGSVRDPGLVTLPLGSRVADAIAAAGGVLRDVDLTGLNLAEHLADGASIVIAGPGGNAVQPGAGLNPAGHGSGANTGAVININTADVQLLEGLPGVGPVTAGSIIAYREQHGPFTDIGQLRAVSGIGPATFARLQARVTV